MVFTQRNFAADFLQAKCDFTRKMAVLRFWARFGGLLGATCDDHLRLTGKRVVDFVLVLTELFSPCVTAEALWANIGSKSAISLQRGPLYPTFQVEGVAPTSHSSSQESRQNGLSYGIKIWRDLRFCHNPRVWQTDRQTDRQTELTSLDRVCISCSAVKTFRMGHTGHVLLIHSIS